MKGSFYTTIIFSLINLVLVGQEHNPPDKKLFSSPTQTGLVEEDPFFKAREEIRLLPGFSLFPSVADKDPRFAITNSLNGQVERTSALFCYQEDPQVLPNESYYEGFIEHKVELDEGGNLIFEVPIIVPVGVNGMEPKVSISSNPAKLFGVVGKGMGLNASSYILKTDKSIFFDGEAGFNAQDQEIFSLNGQKLIANESEPNEFLLENNHSLFVKKKIGSMVGSGYEIEVQHAGGKVDTYKPIVIKNSQTYAWVLQQSIDKYGNKIEYGFLNLENGFPLISEIKYNFHEGVAGSLIQFSYDKNNQDFIAKYWRDQIYHPDYTKFLLSKIKVFNRDHLLKTYSFEYNNNSCVDAPELTKVNLKTRNGKYCPPIELVRELRQELDFNEITENHPLIDGPLDTEKYPLTINRLDFNNDGNEDFMVVPFISDYSGKRHRGESQSYLAATNNYDTRTINEREYDLGPFITHGNPIPVYRAKKEEDDRRSKRKDLVPAFLATANALAVQLAITASGATVLAPLGGAYLIGKTLTKLFSKRSTDKYYDLVGFEKGRYTVQHSILDFNNDGVSDIIYRDYLHKNPDYLVSDIRFKVGVVNSDGKIDELGLDGLLSENYSMIPVDVGPEITTWWLKNFVWFRDPEYHKFIPEIYEFKEDLDFDGREDLLVLYRSAVPKALQTYFTVYVRFANGEIIPRTDISNLIATKFKNPNFPLVMDYLFLEDLDNNGKKELIFSSGTHNNIIDGDHRNHIALEIDYKNKTILEFVNSNLVSGEGILDLDRIITGIRGDFNSDGIGDILFYARPDPNQYSKFVMYFGDGSGNFIEEPNWGTDREHETRLQIQQAFVDQLATPTIQVADFDQNGYPDLLTSYRNRTSQQGTGYTFKLHVLLNNGNGFEKAELIYTADENSENNPPGGPNYIGSYLDAHVNIMDVNGDNTPDIYLQYKPNIFVPEFDDYTRKILLTNPRSLAGQNNFAKPGMIREVHAKNASYFVDYKPSYANKFKLKDDGECNLLELGIYSEKSVVRDDVSGGIMSRILPVRLMTTYPRQDGKFDLLSCVFQRVLHPINHFGKGFLGYELSLRSKALIEGQTFNSLADARLGKLNSIDAPDSDGSRGNYGFYTTALRNGLPVSENKWVGARLELFEQFEGYSILPIPDENSVLEFTERINFQSDYHQGEGPLIAASSVVKDIEKFHNGVNWSNSSKTVVLNQHGLPTRVEDYVDGRLLKSTITEYEDLPDYWKIPLLPKNKTIKRLCIDQRCTYSENEERVIFSYEPSLYDLTSEQFYHKEAGIFSLNSEREILGYDEFGNMLGEKIVYSDTPTEPVTQTFDYSDDGRYLVGMTNTLGHSSTTTWDEVLDKIKTETNANGLQSFKDYDKSGRLFLSRDPSGLETRYEFNWSFNELDAKHRVLFSNSSTTTGQSAVTEYVNNFGEVVLTKSKDANSDNFVHRGVEYGTDGRILKSYEPTFLSAFENGNIEAEWIYNYRGEVIETKGYKGGGLSQVNKSSIEVDPTSNSIKLKTIDNNSNGLVQFVNGLGQNSVTSRYALSTETPQVDRVYNSLGKLDQVYPPSGEPVTFSYDARGFQTAMNDPDFGQILYGYNNKGELKSQNFVSNSNPKSFIMDYDILGRLSSQILSDVVDTYEDKYTYDADPKNLGSLNRVESKYETQNYEYDFVGNLEKVTTSIGGSDYFTSLQYDDLNRLHRKKFASGIEIEYRYHNSKGHLEELKSGGVSIWKLADNNERGQITGFTRANGDILNQFQYDGVGYPEIFTVSSTNGGIISQWEYEFDPQQGNLKSRENLTLPPGGFTKERFEYTGFNQLEKVYFINTVTDEEVLHSSLSYSLSGNIESKSDVAEIWEYGENAGPHAVTKLSKLHQSIPYANCAITYNALNQPRNIVDQNGNYSYSLEYGIDGQRVHMTGNIPFQEANEQIVGKVFMDDEEWLFMEGGKHIINHFVRAGGMLVAIIQKRSDSEDTEIFYPITDYLGSIIAICNREGEIINRRSYDAWGRPRNPFSWDDYENITFKVTNRGYTMHEHMLNAGLINMNGRVYDPVIGRMLSPDNYVQDMSNPQNYNRYSYVLNNPLKYVDPSGELVEDGWYIDEDGNNIGWDGVEDDMYYLVSNKADVGLIKKNNETEGGFTKQEDLREQVELLPSPEQRDAAFVPFMNYADGDNTREYRLSLFSKYYKITKSNTTFKYENGGVKGAHNKTTEIAVERNQYNFSLNQRDFMIDAHSHNYDISKTQLQGQENGPTQFVDYNAVNLNGVNKNIGGAVYDPINQAIYFYSGRKPHNSTKMTKNAFLKY